MTKKLSISRVYDATLAEVWQLWTDPELIKQWWGPDKFICDVAKIDFREGGTSLVNMKAPREFGGAEYFNTWVYTKIVLHESIAYTQHLADENGVKQKPTAVGMPPDFPEDVVTVVSFNGINENKTEVTVTEFADFGQTTHFAKIGLEQSLAKISSILNNRRGGSGLNK